MAALSDGQIRQIEQQLNARPEIVQALSANAAGSRGLGGRLGYDPRLGDQRAQASDVYHRFGISFPDAEDYNIVRDARSGQLRLDHHGYFSRNADWLVPVITFASAGIGSAIASGASGTAAGATTTSVPGTASTLPSTSTIGASTLPAGGAGISTAAAAGGTGASIWSGLKDHTNPLNNSNGGNRADALGTLGALIPLLIRRAQNGGDSGGGDSNSPFGGGEVSKEIAGLLNLQGQRLKDMMPVRQAALRLAMSMAPSAATTPRLNEAAQNASMPRPTTAQDPQVMAALQRLMGGG